MSSITEVHAAVAAANAGFCEAINRGDIGAACQVYTADACLLSPEHAMVRGREAIAAFWKATVPAMGVQRVALRTVDLAVSGSMAREIGEATLALATGQAVIKYVVVWQREADGTWRWSVDIWNNGGVG